MTMVIPLQKQYNLSSPVNVRYVKDPIILDKVLNNTAFNCYLLLFHEVQKNLKNEFEKISSFPHRKEIFGLISDILNCAENE